MVPPTQEATHIHAPADTLTDKAIMFMLCFQLIALASLHRVPWYTPTTGTTDLRTYVAPETSVIYLTNLAQFVILAVVFNKGHPHRQATSLLTRVPCLVAQLLVSGNAFAVPGACLRTCCRGSRCCFVVCAQRHCMYCTDSSVTHLPLRLVVRCRQPLWTNISLSVAMVLQVAFIVYSLFSVDAFTLNVQEIVGKDPPMGLPTSYRATLLVILIINAAAAGCAMLLSVLVLQLLGKMRAQPWWQRRLEEQSSSAQALLANGAAHGPGPGRMSPTSVQLTGTKGPVAASANGLHMPALQTPAGAALL